MKKKRILDSICRLSFHNGKRAFAVVFDAVFIWAIVFASIRVTLAPSIRNGIAAWLAAAFFTLTLFFTARVVQRERFVRHRLKLRLEAREALALSMAERDPERILKLIPKEKGVAVSLKTDILTTDDVYSAVRENGLPLTIVTFAKPTEKAAQTAQRYGGALRIVPPQEMLGIGIEKLCPVTEQEIDDEVIRTHRELIERRGLKEIFLAVSRKRAVKYLLVGAGLYLFSFIMGRGLYYRIIASVSVTAGGIMLALDAAGKTAGEKKKPA